MGERTILFGSDSESQQCHKKRELLLMHVFADHWLLPRRLIFLPSQLAQGEWKVKHKIETT